MPTTKPRSGNPAKKAAAKKAVTSAKQWKKANAANELELPSGNVCRVKRPGLPQLLAENVLPDMLTPIAMEAVEAGQSGKKMSKADAEAQFSELLTKPGGMDAMFAATDKITAHCVVEPQCLYHMRRKAEGQLDQIQEGFEWQWEVIPEDERDPDALYTDEVDDQDKFYIFNYVVGGTADLESFRSEFAESMDGIQPK
jgi:hypothetical protein